MKICNTIDLELNISMPPKVKSNGVAALKIYMIPVDVNVWPSSAPFYNTISAALKYV